MKINKKILTGILLTGAAALTATTAALPLTSCSTQPETPTPAPKKGYIEFQSDLHVTTKTLIISKPGAYTFKNLLIEKDETYKTAVNKSVIEKLTTLSDDWDLYFKHTAYVDTDKYGGTTMISIHGWMSFAKWHNDVWKVLESSNQEYPINSKTTQIDNDNPEIES